MLDRNKVRYIDPMAFMGLPRLRVGHTFMGLPRLRVGHTFMGLPRLRVGHTIGGGGGGVGGVHVCVGWGGGGGRTVIPAPSPSCPHHLPLCRCPPAPVPAPLCHLPPQELRLEENGLKSLNNLHPLLSLHCLYLGGNRISEALDLDRLSGRCGGLGGGRGGL